MKKIFTFLLFTIIFSEAWSQKTITVTVTQQCSSMPDCDNVLFDVTGDSDNAWQFLPYDQPDLDGNGPPSTVLDVGTEQYYNETTGNNIGCSAVNDLIFSENYGCPGGCFPSGMNIDWQFFEQDGVYPASIIDGSVSGTTLIAIPDTSNNTYTQIITGNVTGGCSGTMSITVQVTVSGSFALPVEDNICNAIPLAIGVSETRAWCSNQTFETGEPNVPSSGPQDMSPGTCWYYFVAPPSGSVYVNTNLPNTSIGTKFILYHASNAFGCDSLSYCYPDKFHYLSELNGGNADVSITLAFPFFSDNADLELDCGNLLAGFAGVIPGETYYIQLTTDNMGVCGSIEIEVSDDGGSGPPAWDVPCGAVPFTPSATPISDGAGSAPSVSLNFSCANDFEIETDNPHAYPYDDNILSNDPTAPVWASFVAPLSGAVSIEVNCTASGEFFVLYEPDPCIAPAIPSEYNCVDLIYDPANSGGDGNLGLGGTTAQNVVTCLEPGYTYYIMADPPLINFCSDLDIWAYIPPVTVPGNNVLCQAITNPAYNIPIGAAGSGGTTVTGTNLNACQEYLAGEPVLGGAAATVWYYFTAPPSGVVNMTLIPGTIGNIAYGLYNVNPFSVGGTGCYGGLDGATGSTYTDSPTSDVTIESLFSGNNNDSIITDFCCLDPGSTYLLQVDGTAPSSQGTFTINMEEVVINTGSVLVDNFSNFICFGDYVHVTSNGEIVPSCMTNGIIVHGEGPNPTPTDIITGNVYAVTPISSNSASFVNDGSSTTIPFNTLVHASAIVDGNADAGFDFSTFCPSMQVSTGAPFVFLEPIVINPGAITGCNASFTVSGGLPAYSPLFGYSYSITSTTGVLVASGSNLAELAVVNFTALGAGDYIISVSDTISNNGGRCDVLDTITVSTGCQCYMDLSVAPDALSISQESFCGPGCQVIGGAWCLHPTPCPLGSSLYQFSSAIATISSGVMTSPPLYNSLISETYFLRCVCDSDSSFVSPPQSITSTPGTCAAAVLAPAGITTTPSSCIAGSLAGGSFNGLATACPLGTTLTYYNDVAGTDGASIITPTFDQDGPPQTLYCACVDIVSGCSSTIVTVGPTTIGTCTPGCGATIGSFPNGN